jgi:hypothetical protein
VAGYVCSRELGDRRKAIIAARCRKTRHPGTRALSVEKKSTYHSEQESRVAVRTFTELNLKELVSAPFDDPEARA